MKKRTLTKGMLMAALICGCVQWGVQRYTLKNYKSLLLTR